MWNEKFIYRCSNKSSQARIGKTHFMLPKQSIVFYSSVLFHFWGSTCFFVVNKIQLIFDFQEEQNRGKLNWEHLNDELHVLITVEDTENRANLKMQRAIDEVKKLLIVVS